jgi:hypothetical protein
VNQQNLFVPVLTVPHSKFFFLPKLVPKPTQNPAINDVSKISTTKQKKRGGHLIPIDVNSLFFSLVFLFFTSDFIRFNLNQTIFLFLSNASPLSTPSPPHAVLINVTDKRTPTSVRDVTPATNYHKVENAHGLLKSVSVPMV